MSHPLVMLDDMTDRKLDSELAALSRQRMAFTRQQVLALGGTDDQLVRRVRSGQLLEPARGIYTDPAHPCTWLQRVEVARLDASLDALACQPTAAVLNRFDDFRQGRPHILVPFGTTNHSRLAVIHQTRHLGAIDRCYPQGIPSTTPE